MLEQQQRLPTSVSTSVSSDARAPISHIPEPPRIKRRVYSGKRRVTIMNYNLILAKRLCLMEGIEPSKINRMSKAKVASIMLRNKTEPYFSEAKQWLEAYTDSIEDPSVGTEEDKYKMYLDNMKILEKTIKILEKTDCFHGFVVGLGGSKNRMKFHSFGAGVGSLAKSLLEEAGICIQPYLEIALHRSSISNFKDALNLAEALPNNVGELRKFVLKVLKKKYFRFSGERVSQFPWNMVGKTFKINNFPDIQLSNHKSWNKETLKSIVQCFDKLEFVKISSESIEVMNSHQSNDNPLANLDEVQLNNLLHTTFGFDILDINHPERVKYLNYINQIEISSDVHKIWLEKLNGTFQY